MAFYKWITRAPEVDHGNGAADAVGPSVMRADGRRYQIDVVGVEPDRNGTDRICVIGETKAEREPMGLGQLERLDEVAHKTRAHSKSTVRRLLVARSGFTSELRRAARIRSDVELVELSRLYKS